jgi:glycine/D-amino acid oxidase-like deaminating enzyme
MTNLEAAMTETDVVIIGAGHNGLTCAANLEIPDCRGACHRAALRADPLAASGMAMVRMQRRHRSFSVERPASANSTEMIQNRITICGSVQPSCSK